MEINIFMNYKFNTRPMVNIMEYDYLSSINHRLKLSDMKIEY